MAPVTSSHPLARKSDLGALRIASSLASPFGRAESAIRQPETIATYDRLATEYDLAIHETTRSLESASIKGLGLALSLVSKRARILELGCGTGVATGLLSAGAGVATIIATDPSHRMLAQAAAKLSAITSRSVDWTAATASRALCDHADVDLVVGALSDPYLDETIVPKLAERLRPGTCAFFSVPSKRWAALERGTRLGVPMDQTRFRSVEGNVLYARSLTLEPDELERLLTAHGMHAVDAGAVDGPSLSEGPQPEVSWVLVRR